MAGSRAPGARPERLRRSAREEEEEFFSSAAAAAAAASSSSSSSSVPSRLRSSCLCFSLGKKVLGFFCSGGGSRDETPAPPPGISTAPGMGEEEEVEVFSFGGASSTAVAESAVVAFSTSDVVRGEEELEELEEEESVELAASDDAAFSLFCWSAGARRSGNIFLPRVTCLRTSRSCLLLFFERGSRCEVRSFFFFFEKRARPSGDEAARDADEACSTREREEKETILFQSAISRLVGFLLRQFQSTSRQQVERKYLLPRAVADRRFKGEAAGSRGGGARKNFIAKLDC